MGPKQHIGKILIEKKQISQKQLSAALEHQRASGGKLASSLMEMGLAGEEELLAALGEQLGVPAVDLSKSIIALEALKIVPAHVAAENCVLPLLVEPDRVILAIADPADKKTIDEISFITGKKVEPYVALEARIKNVVREAYAVREQNPETRFYRGERSSFPEGKENPHGFLAIISQHLPEIEIEPEKELLNIEVSTSEEILLELDTQATDSLQQTVLAVDDELEVIQLLEKALIKEGFGFLYATRGLEALQAVKTHHPHLVILDAMLPEIHGFEICRKIKTSKRFGHIPVVIISAVYRGWRFAEDVKEIYGADDYFEKPFRILPLIRRVRELLNAGPSNAENQLEPEAAAQAYQKGISLYQQGQSQAAEAALREACQFDPFDHRIHYALATVLLAKNQIYEAMREYEHTIELKPDLFMSLKNLAILYQKKGFKNKAVEMWERALHCSPQEKDRLEIRTQLLKLL